jgi:hypothetical protein
MKTPLPPEVNPEKAASCLSLDRRQFLQFLGGGMIVSFWNRNKMEFWASSAEQASEEVIPWREIV